MVKNISIKVGIVAAFLMIILLSVLSNSKSVSAEKYSRIHMEPSSITWVCDGKDNTSVVNLVGYKGKQKVRIKDAEFFSKNSNILTVMSNGNLGIDESRSGTIKSGTTYICAKFEGKEYCCKIKKVNPKMNKKSVTLTLGENNKCQFKMSDITDVKGKKLPCTWTSSEPSKVTVDPDNGLVTAKKECKNVTIECSVNGKKTFSGKVTVKMNHVRSLSMEKTMTLQKNESKFLRVSVNPSNAYNKNIIWRSSDERIVSVDKNGNVTGHNMGKAIITAVAEDNSQITATCEITVPMSGNEVTISSNDLTITTEPKTLSLTDSTNQLTGDRVNWSVSNSKVISISSENGLSTEVTGIADGVATVQARVRLADESEITLSCNVTVALLKTEISVEVSCKSPSGANSLSEDGMLYVTIENKTSKAIAIMHYDMDISFEVKEKSYSLYFIEGSLNEDNFKYREDGSVSCIERGNKKVYVLAPGDSDELRELRKQYSNFKSGTFKFYYYDEDGKKHLVKVSANGKEYQTLTQVSAEIISSETDYFWKAD